ncbi:tyrosine-protein phosphatase non-receptor type 4 [Paragonimus westermani]|uniref:Tyrosine-protein phosphatase non-receptor type 4 n=1 Tax=Paragonimus westermani TaxID=34504 RepID=A0A5J4P2M4_9TREM|nr:tyrosine-protein phosphatase non-receptor type 4 [Paragonimus westermani]
MLSGGSYNVAEAEQSQHTLYVDTIVCTVCLLDSSCVSFKLDKYCRGQILLDLTFDYLELLERDFFGLVFNERQSGEAAIIKWLDPTKKIRKQCSDQPPYTFWFRVKFYVSDPICLQQEYTRYQFFLQVRKDILEGRLPVTKSTSAHLAGLILQAELGDFNPEDCRPGYVSQFRFIQQQTAEFESQASDWHRKFSCMLPDAAELEFLNVARQLDRYGVKTQEAFDAQDNSSSVLIGVSFAGITVFRAGKTGFQFPWNNVMSIRYKGKKFTVQLKSPNMAILPINGSVSALMRAPSNVTLTGPSPYPNSDTNLRHVYRFTSTAQSKAFWQYAVACHAFFRVREPTVQSDSVFSRMSNRGGSIGTTSISATAVYAAISRVTSGFRRYFSIVRRNSLSAAGLGGPVGGIERTLSTVMELRRNSRASDRGFSRSNSRRSLRRSAVNSIAAASLTQSTGLRTTSNLSLTADRPVGPGGDQIPSNPMPIKSYAQMPPGARVPVINTGSLRLPPATSSASRPVPITQLGSAALTDDLPHSNQLRQSSLNPGSSSRVKKIPSLNEPATGSNLISPKPGVRSSEPRVKERRILADLSTRASEDLSVSDHSEDAENAEFDRDEAARYWHVRRTQAVSRPTRLPSKGRGIPSAMHESFHNRNEPDVRLDTSSNRSSRHANEYDLTNLTASTEAMANKSDPLRPKSTSQPELHERTHPSAVTHSKGSGHQTSSKFVRDPFHPGAPAGESCSTVEPEVNDGLVWIRIRPDSHGHFGFNIRGGADFGAPIIVSRVAPNMPADLCIPRLSEGDQLIAINGRNVAGHTHAEVNSFIRGAREDQSGLLELLVKPGDYVTDDFNEDSEVPDSGDAPPLPPRTPQPSSRQSSMPLSAGFHRHNVLPNKHGSLVSYAQSLDGTEDPLLLSVLELECGLADGSILTRFEVSI